MRQDPVIVVGMSASDARDEVGLRAETLRRRWNVAFLQQADPSLTSVLTRVADSGARRVLLIGVSVDPLAPAHSWLRRIAAYWWRNRVGFRPVLNVATRLTSSLTELEELARDVKPISGTEPGLTSAAWESVSGHRHQLNVCRGPRCTASGSEGNVRALVLAMLERGLGDEHVLMMHTGCQFPCNQAPVMSVQPDDVWYGHVDPAVATRIVHEHLGERRPVESHRLPRMAPP